MDRETIDFAVALTGHDEQTIKQMYRDWVRSPSSENKNNQPPEEYWVTLSPVQKERTEQIEQLKDIWPGFPNCSFPWQYLNGLLAFQKPLRKLKDLRVYTDIVLNKLYNERHDIDGAINWADLRCIEANKCISEDGDQYYEVLVSEASPDNYRFQTLVQQELEKMGYKAVIRTEW